MATQWTVRVFRGDSLQQTLPIGDSPLTIGSRAFCDISLESEKIPAEFGCLRLEGGRGAVLLEKTGKGHAVVRLIAGAKFKIDPFMLAITQPSTGLTEAAHVLDAVFALLSKLWRAEDEAGVLKAMLSTLLETFGGQWGALVKPAGADQPARVTHALGERPGRPRQTVSRTVLDQVIKERRAVLVADVQSHPDLSHAQSIPLEIQSVIAAPILADGAVRAIFYLESPATLRSFSKDERDLLDRLCQFAGEHFGHARRNWALTQENEKLAHDRRVSTPSVLIAAPGNAAAPGA